MSGKISKSDHPSTLPLRPPCARCGIYQFPFGQSLNVNYCWPCSYYLKLLWGGKCICGYVYDTGSFQFGKCLVCTQRIDVLGG